MALGISRMRFLLAAACLAASPPLAAATLAELEALSDATAEEESGINLAQQQADQGAWLQALATIERVLVAHPKSDTARLLQVFYLCRIDDRPGAEVAYRELQHKRYEKALLADLRTKCNIAERD